MLQMFKTHSKIPLICDILQIDNVEFNPQPNIHIVKHHHIDWYWRNVSDDHPIAFYQQTNKKKNEKCSYFEEN